MVYSDNFVELGDILSEGITVISAKDLKERSGSLNIAYAEDEEMLREGLQSTLSKLFKNVYTAKNGQEALEIIKKEDIDILITDINMPIMGGAELIQSIRHQTDKDPMIVVLSAHNESRLLTSLINMGIDQFLNKPLDKQHLINSLNKVCKIISDRKLVQTYEKQIHDELEIMDRKNKILQQKLNQLAVQTNKNVDLLEKSQAVRKSKSVESTKDYYETLLLDDKEELRDLAGELDSYIAMMFQGDALNEEYLYRLSGVYVKYSSILNMYTEFFEIAAVLHDFAQGMLLYKHKFMEDIEQTGIYFESLQLTLDNYRERVWNQKAKDPRFYNASLKNDVRLIIDFLRDEEAQENEIEFF
jgi:YesN/AraC family two-component response regulator